MTRDEAFDLVVKTLDKLPPDARDVAARVLGEYLDSVRCSYWMHLAFGVGVGLAVGLFLG
jgi:hypothetical protein